MNDSIWQEYTLIFKYFEPKLIYARLLTFLYQHQPASVKRDSRLTDPVPIKHGVSQDVTSHTLLNLCAEEILRDVALWKT